MIPWLFGWGDSIFPAKDQLLMGVLLMGIIPIVGLVVLFLTHEEDNSKSEIQKRRYLRAEVRVHAVIYITAALVAFLSGIWFPLVVIIISLAALIIASAGGGLILIWRAFKPIDGD